MIKIFENEEEPENPAAKDPAALFSLNIAPDIEPTPPETLIDEPVRQKEEEPSPAASDLSAAADPAPLVQPWETIEDEPLTTAHESFGEADIAPVPVHEPPPPSEPAPIIAEPSAYLEDPRPEPEIFAQTPYRPETRDETIRNTGLAWSAGIIFFGSVVFMFIIGWGFDLLFGSSPYGMAGGIVLGSLIGFVQFFRISSQIFRK